MKTIVLKLQRHCTVMHTSTLINDLLLLGWVGVVGLGFVQNISAVEWQAFILNFWNYLQTN